MKLDLEKNDRICFFGDSITRAGMWIAEIAEFFAKNYPEKKIGLYNCGISGSRGFQFDLKDRVYCDCLQLFPKYVVIMFGMNDIHCWLYNPEHPEYNVPGIREKQLELYSDALERMIELFKKEDITPIICSPTPYNQYEKSDSQNYFADSGVEACTKIAQEKAEKHDLLFIDMRTPLLERLNDGVIGADRTHPTDFGHHLMAERFLYAIGAKDKEEPDTPVELSEKNLARKEVESRLRNIMGVERDHFGMQFEPSKPLPERKEILKKAIDEGNFQSCEQYFTDADIRDELYGELIKRTKAMYE